jgi:hypothetical protein
MVLAERKVSFPVRVRVWSSLLFVVFARCVCVCVCVWGVISRWSSFELCVLPGRGSRGGGGEGGGRGKVICEEEG